MTGEINGLKVDDLINLIKEVKYLEDKLEQSKEQFKRFREEALDIFRDAEKSSIAKGWTFISIDEDRFMELIGINPDVEKDYLEAKKKENGHDL